jgi:L-alanine-DL-glutamate epimerase-like enolase superfamily enzyme
MVKELTQRIIGRDPSRIEELWAEMYNHSFWAKGGGSSFLLASAVIEQALWDIKGKALGAPLYELLGGRMCDEFASTPTIGSALRAPEPSLRRPPNGPCATATKR